MRPSKNCEICGNEFVKKPSASQLVWAKSKYCSLKCAAKNPERNAKMQAGRDAALREGRIVVWNKGKKGLQKAWNKGNGDYAKALGFGKWMIGRKGKMNGAWKGEKVGYGALHDWVRREKGTPMECSQCGRQSDVPQAIHWANVSGEYKRELDDWIRLCAKCHRAHDRGRKQKRFIR